MFWIDVERVPARPARLTGRACLHPSGGRE